MPRRIFVFGRRTFSRHGRSRTLVLPRQGGGDRGQSGFSEVSSTFLQWLTTHIRPPPLPLLLPTFPFRAQSTLSSSARKAARPDFTFPGPDGRWESTVRPQPSRGQTPESLHKGGCPCLAFRGTPSAGRGVESSLRPGRLEVGKGSRATLEGGGWAGGARPLVQAKGWSNGDQKHKRDSGPRGGRRPDPRTHLKRKVYNDFTELSDAGVVVCSRPEEVCVASRVHLYVHGRRRRAVARRTLPSVSERAPSAFVP